MLSNEIMTSCNRALLRVRLTINSRKLQQVCHLALHLHLWADLPGFGTRKKSVNGGFVRIFEPEGKIDQIMGDKPMFESPKIKLYFALFAIWNTTLRLCW